jgi:hypothetical protein
MSVQFKQFSFHNDNNIDSSVSLEAGSPLKEVVRQTVKGAEICRVY